MFDEESYRTAFDAMDRDSRSGQYSIITPDPNLSNPRYIDLSPNAGGGYSSRYHNNGRYNSSSNSRGGLGGGGDNYKENRKVKSGSYGDLIGVGQRDYRNFNPYLNDSNGNIDPNNNNNNVRKDWAEQIFNRNNYGDRYYGRQQQPPPRQQQQQLKSKTISRSIDNLGQGPLYQLHPQQQRQRQQQYSPMSSDNEGLDWDRRRPANTNDYYNKRFEGGGSRNAFRTLSESSGDPNFQRRRYYEESTSSDDRTNIHPPNNYAASRATAPQQQFQQMNMSPRSIFNDSESGDEILVVKGTGMGGGRNVSGDLIRNDYVKKFDLKPPSGRQAIRSYGSHSRLDNNIAINNNNNNNNSSDSDKTTREYRYSSSSNNDNPRYQQQQQQQRQLYNSSDNLLYDRSNASKPRFASTTTTTAFRNNDNNNADNNNNSFSNVTSRTTYNNNNNNNINNNKDGGVKDKEFLKKIQQELESQRMNWTGEIDKLLSPMSADLERTRPPLSTSSLSPPSSSSPSAMTSFNAEKNSFIDTSGPMAVFKAFVDVSDYPAKSVSVRMDNWTNKLIVEAHQDENPINHVATSFTQRIPLPKYADVSTMSAKVNRQGIVKIEVPLLFYFPQDHNNNHVTSGSRSGKTTYSSNTNNQYGKSYVYEVKTDPRDGSKVMEIVVKPGPEVNLKDIRIEVGAGDRQLTIFAERPGNPRQVIKTYTLPETAFIDGIRSKMQSDGLLLVTVPIRQ